MKLGESHLARNITLGVIYLVAALFVVAAATTPPPATAGESPTAISANTSTEAGARPTGSPPRRLSGELLAYRQLGTNG